MNSTDFMSRWCGDNEKNLKNLFAFAREKQPCIVFIDDIDVLCEQRNDTEHEWPRRVKTEFLIQMHGILSRSIYNETIHEYCILTR